MKKKNEKPVPFMVRLYKKENAIVTRIARKVKMSRATVIRAAILMYGDTFL